MNSHLPDTRDPAAERRVTHALSPRDSVRLDPGLVSRLLHDLGEDEGELALLHALEELAARLRRAEAEYRRGELVALRRTARGIATLAPPVGFNGVARAARGVEDTALGGDTTALAATTARLLRVGDRSLAEIWEQQVAE